MSEQSIEKMSMYYKMLAPMFKQQMDNDAADESYGMHIGYQEKDNLPENNRLSSKLMERRIIMDADIKDGQQILDSGCGTGTLVFEITSLYPNSIVHGIDLFKNHIEIASRHRAKNNLPNALFSIQDYLNLAFRDNSFDRAIFCESMIHAYDKTQLLLETRRVLKPKGKIIIADIFMLSSNLTRKERLDSSNFSKKIGAPNFENFLTFVQELKRLGFQDILYQDITNNLSATIPSNTDQDLHNPHKQSSEAIELIQLDKLLSSVGDLLSNKAAGYFIITASINK